MIPRPHGGRLVSRIVSGNKRERMLKEAEETVCIEIGETEASEIYNIATGGYSPLEGFMTQDEYQSTLDNMRLPNDLPWTIPIILDVDREALRETIEGDSICLAYKSRPIALLDIEEKYRWDKREFCRKVYGTIDPLHPGVASIQGRKEWLVGGKVLLLDNPSVPYYEYMLAPKETRVLFREKGWRTVAAFQTRNVPHMGHEFVQKAALTFTDGLLVHPLVGWKKKGDYKDEVIVKAYSALIKHYFPKDTVVLSVLWMQMRYAGPREAVHHAIVRKNYGATHFIVGRDHAGVPGYYGPYDAWYIFENFPDLGITPLFIRESFYCRKCGGMATSKTCPHPEEYRIKISGTRIREMLMKGQPPPETMMRPEVSRVVLQYEDPFI